MFAVDPAQRITMAQVIASNWMTAAYAPYLSREGDYRNDLLNRRRASQRWARLTAAARSFGRAVISLGGVLESVRGTDAKGGAAATVSSAGMTELGAGGESSLDVTDPDGDELMAPSLLQRGSSYLGSWAAPLPQLFRSLSSRSAMSEDDEMGPPVWRSGASPVHRSSGAPADMGVAPPSPLSNSSSLRGLSHGLGDLLGDTVRGVGEAVGGVQPPPVVKQKARVYA